jgi:hypothetical protein
MPWLAVRFGADVIGTLSDTFGVEGIPTLLLVSPTGTVLCKDARSRVEAEPEGYPWPKLPCEVRRTVFWEVYARSMPSGVLFGYGCSVSRCCLAFPAAPRLPRYDIICDLPHTNID